MGDLTETLASDLHWGVWGVLNIKITTWPKLDNVSA